MNTYRELIKNKQRIVIKIGSSSLIHTGTGKINFYKMEQLVRIISDIRNSGKDVVLVTSGAIAVGSLTLGLLNKPEALPVKQACAAVGQANLMMLYQKLFAEYNQIAAQILITKNAVLNDISRVNTENTFQQLLFLGAVPIVNENDTVSTYEIEQAQSFGDNDRLSAIVCSLIHADLLILLSDIDGLYTDDPNTNKNAVFIKEVPVIDEKLIAMGKTTTGSRVGTGGMTAKIEAARIATNSGADMIITNGNDLNHVRGILNGEDIGTLFLAHKDATFNLLEMIS